MDPIYKDGYEAFKHGIDVDECHYPSSRSADINEKRNQWLKGWYTARYDQFWNKWLNNKSEETGKKLRQIFKEIEESEDKDLDKPPF